MSGGHATAHAPAHALLPRVSLTKRYRVWPRPSTRIRPSPELPTPTVVRVAAECDDAHAPLRPIVSAAAAASAPTARNRVFICAPFVSWKCCALQGLHDGGDIPEARQTDGAAHAERDEW